MSCCAHANAAGRFFSFFAKRYRKRFQKKGLEPCQHQLVKGLKRAGIKNAKLLEIGCGVGYLHQCLLEDGAAYALGIDLSEKMLSEAKQWAKDRNMEACTAYRLGDFLDIADTVEKADITILDKVVCCYPDANGLLHTALDKTRNTIALTYPRNRWYIRFVMKLAGVFLWLLRCPFRSYVHDPKQIKQWITAQGFRKIYQNKTLIWLTQVYIKSQ
jgi:2-polyprenyl-3-methyl-5-hydroxy-6-metoxy-1,4-benzoquinol methylase